MSHSVYMVICCLQDALVDTLKLVPFLFVTYLAIELLEHRALKDVAAVVSRARIGGPVVGALFGVIPQCGFSATAAALYSNRMITLGTLCAVFLSTSDEMLPVFIAEQAPLSMILSILGVKVFIGIITGFAIDFIMRLMSSNKTSSVEIEVGNQGSNETDRSARYAHHNQHSKLEVGSEATVDKQLAECPCASEDRLPQMFICVVKHVLEVSVFILIITLILNIAIEYVGLEVLSSFASKNEVLSILCSAVIGLIPNCAASVIIAQLYLAGLLGSGAMIAGLLVSAGVGTLVLLRLNRPARHTVCIIVGLFVLSLIWGFAIDGLGIRF